MYKKALGLLVALLFLLGMVTLSGPDILVRRALDAIRRVNDEARRRTEVAWQLRWARHYLCMVDSVMGMTTDITVPGLWWQGNYVIVINHRNVLDHLVAARVFHEIGIRDPRWVVKEQLRRAPIVGGSLERAGFAFVSRSKDPSDLDRIRAMAKLARADGVSVAIYPEGTRFTGTPKQGSPYTAVGEPRDAGFTVLCEELPNYKVLVICIDWEDPKDARTIWDGSAYVDRQVKVSVWEDGNPGRRGARALLNKTWRAMDHHLKS